jgi:hypothetical protein
MKQPSLDWSAAEPATLVVAPSVYPQARETSALAAVANRARSNHNARVLALITASGDAGMSDYEIQCATGLGRASICLRRFDLRAFLIPATRRALSQSKRPMVCWRRRTASEMTA